jgi:hypothetical protein
MSRGTMPGRTAIEPSKGLKMNAATNSSRKTTNATAAIPRVLSNRRTLDFGFGIFAQRSGPCGPQGGRGG